MDPNATLEEIRRLNAEGNSDEAMFLFVGLDGWITGGGFLPADWSR
jgi:hypothetical protein